MSDYVSSFLSLGLLALAVAGRLPQALGRPRLRVFGAAPLRVLTPALLFVPALALSAVYSWGQLIPALGSTSSFWKYEEWAELCRYLAFAGLALESATAYRGDGGLQGRARFAEPLVVAFAGVSLAATVVLAVLSARNGTQIVHIAH